MSVIAVPTQAPVSVRPDQIWSPKPLATSAGAHPESFQRNISFFLKFTLSPMLSPKQQYKTYLVVPKEGDPIRVQAEHLNMSSLNRSIRLFNGQAAETKTVALFSIQSVVGVIEQDSMPVG